MTWTCKRRIIKKLIVLAVCLIVGSILSAGQATAGTEFDFGIKLGFSTTGMVGSDIEKTSFPKTGFTGGAFGCWRFLSRGTL